MKTATQDIEIPFGKHKGCFVCELPTSYIEWCLDNIEKLSSVLRQSLENELEFRIENGRESNGSVERTIYFSHQDAPPPAPKPQPRPQQSQSQPNDVVRKIADAINRWHVQGMRSLHPDRNIGKQGATEMFVEFQKQAERLKAMLGDLGIKVEIKT